MSRTLILWVAILLMFLGASVIYATWKLTQPGQPGYAVVEDPDVKVTPTGARKDAKWIDEFALTERSGQQFGTDDLDGKVWVGSFFFASCTGSCQKQNTVLMTLQNEFGPEGVKFVSITCDPATDTPEKLREYAEGFNAHRDQWYFLTGDLNYIQRVGGEYFGLAVEKVSHQDRFAVVDKWGNVRGRYNWTDPIQLDRLKKVLPELLAETEEPQEFVEAKKQRAEQLAATTVSDDAEQDQAAADDDPAADSNEADAEAASTN